jgi:hypothetical protein
MKSQFIQIRVTSKEKSALVRKAKMLGLDLSKFLLQPVTPSVSDDFIKLVSELASSSRVQTQLAELNDLLTSATGDQIHNLPKPNLERLDEEMSNYVTACVEYSAWKSGTSPPDWVNSVSPLKSPFFGSALIALRPYLLKVSPPPFRARNIFIDSTIGDRV